uniref:Sec-independent protein translocase component tatA/E n=1 Tax=Pleurosigma intermedium TaxID=197753 RepID=A0A8F9R4P5_9STRA|nr:Sec-independent protein translocase component tatA/E [Pleurosigma sp. mgcode 4]
MRNISFGQILILLFLCFLLFGDFISLKKKLLVVIKKFIKLISKENRKKGSWTPDLWFWKPLFYQLNYFPNYLIKLYDL